MQRGHQLWSRPMPMPHRSLWKDPDLNLSKIPKLSEGIQNFEIRKFECSMHTLKSVTDEKNLRIMPVSVSLSALRRQVSHTDEAVDLHLCHVEMYRILSSVAYWRKFDLVFKTSESGRKSHSLGGDSA